MKNQLSGNFTSTVKKVLTAATFAFVLAISAFPAQAFAKDKAARTEAPVEVKYLGLYDANPVIQINIENAAEDDMYYTLRDEEGNVIYTERFKDRKLTRKFQLNAHEPNSYKVVLSLYSKSDKKVQNFEISNVTTVVEDVVVTKVR